MTSPINLSFDDNTVKKLVTEGILANLTEESKQAIFTEAIARLLEPPKNSWGNPLGESPLQQAFNNAILRVANQFAVEMVENDPTIREQVLAKIHTSVADALASADVTYAIGAIIHKALERAANDD